MEPQVFPRHGQDWITQVRRVRADSCQLRHPFQWPFCNQGHSLQSVATRQHADEQRVVRFSTGNRALDTADVAPSFVRNFVIKK